MTEGSNDRGGGLFGGWIGEWRLAAFLGSVLSIGAALPGCGSSDAPETAPVSGTVTMQGKPLPSVGVTFFPPKGPIASGNTNERGEFTLTTNSPGDGAPLGLNQVTIGAAEEGPPKPGAVRIPDRYGQPGTSELTAEVKAGEKNVFTFELKP